MKVSAIIVTHNRLQLLKRAIDSVIGQTYPDIECIVVDNASTDGTAEYLSSRKDIRHVSITTASPNGGVCHARNVGLNNATGEWVMTLDDDDYWLPTAIERLMTKALPGTDVVYCGFRRETVTATGDVTYNDCYPDIDLATYTAERIFFHFPLLGGVSLIRKDFLLALGGWDERLQFWQDRELSFRLAESGTFQCLDEILVVVRNDAGDKGRLSNNVRNWERDVRFIYRKHRNRYRRLPLRDRIKAHRVICVDGINRCNACGDKIRRAFYFIRLKIVNSPRFIRRRLSGDMHAE